MNIRSLTVAAITLGTASAAGAVAPVKVELVKNGGFESLTANAAAGQYHICDNTKSTCVSIINDWTATASSKGTTGTKAPGSVLLAGNGGKEWNSGIGLYGPVPNSPVGGNFVGIDGDSTYSQSISQVINGLTVGKIYNLKFYQSAAQQKGLSGATTEQWSVTFGSTTKLSTNQFNPSKSFLPWTLQTMLFTATSVSQKLTFLAKGTPNGLPPVVLLDGVSLTADLPEPSSWAMMITGFGFIGFTARRRRQREVAA